MLHLGVPRKRLRLCLSVASEQFNFAVRGLTGLHEYFPIAPVVGVMIDLRYSGRSTAGYVQGE